MSDCLRPSFTLGLALLAVAFGGCSGEVDVEGDEQSEHVRHIRSAIAPEVDGTVEVEVQQDGEEVRQVDITVTGTPTDSLGVGPLMASDSVGQTLEDRAEASARP